MENTTAPIAEQKAEPKHKLRWYQYSLRTLLICVTLFAFACSWFAVKMRQAKRQQEAVETLTKCRYNIGYDGVYPRRAPEWIIKLLGENFFYNVDEVGEWPNYSIMFRAGDRLPTLADADMSLFQSLPGLRILRLQNLHGESAALTDEGIVYLEGLKNLEILDLSGTDITDAGLSHISGLDRLRELRLCGTKITDAGLETVKGWTELRELRLRGSCVTDAGLEKIGRMTQIRELDVSFTRITDAGLRHLEGMSNLQELLLFNTQITDDGLEYLKGLSNIEYMDIGDSQVTDKGLKSLSKLTKMRRLECDLTHISADGVASLRVDLPKLEVPGYMK